MPVAKCGLAGKEVPIDSFVNVEVATGPSTIPLEDYSCITFNHAKSELKKLGLVAEYGGTAPMLTQCPKPNFVALQDPDPGTEVESGSTVTLYTGADESPSPSP